VNYLNWDEITIPNDSSAEYIADKYENGYLFTRKGKGVMHQTRSVRIDLSKFELSSENRRLLRKGGSVVLERASIPYPGYSWRIAKIAKDFYDKKTDHAFSANKIKELLTTSQSFNAILDFKEAGISRGYAIAYENASMLHYSYPFYDLENALKDMGLIMMTKMIADAQSRGLSYVYLGSLQRPGDTYKLQFAGLEWFDGGPDGSGKWSTDLEKVKEILTTAATNR
jgi:arginyl-tRNA--protein-N-Asp/Glu arginylyltransferase